MSRQCTVLADTVGRWWWCACLCRRDTVKIDLLRHVDSHSTWKQNPSRVAWQHLWLAEENYLLPCGHTNDLLHEDGDKKCKCVGEGDNEEGEMDGFWSQPRAGVLWPCYHFLRPQSPSHWHMLLRFLLDF